MAVTEARRLAALYDDLVPLVQLQVGFAFEGKRVSFGSFQKGIHRAQAQRGPAALTLTTSLKDPYGDAYDEGGALFTYAYRAGAIDQADNRALRGAFELRTPLVYFRAMAPGQYLVIAPMFVTADDAGARAVLLEPGLPVQDMQPGGLVSAQDVRAYATREARLRLHQQRFKLDVMRAYRHRSDGRRAHRRPAHAGDRRADAADWAARIPWGGDRHPPAARGTAGSHALRGSFRAVHQCCGLRKLRRLL